MGLPARFVFFLLAAFAFLIYFLPSEPFLVNFLEETKDLSESQVIFDVFPLWTYSECIFLFLFVFASDLTRVLPLILFGLVAEIVTILVLICCNRLIWLQLEQITNALFSSASQLLFTAYVFYCVTPAKFQQISSIVRSVSLLSTMMSSLVGQILVSFFHVHVSYLFVISLCAICLSLFIAFLLPLPSSRRTDYLQNRVNINESTTRCSSNPHKDNNRDDDDVLDLEEKSLLGNPTSLYGSRLDYSSPSTAISTDISSTLSSSSNEDGEPPSSPRSTGSDMEFPSSVSSTSSASSNVDDSTSRMAGKKPPHRVDSTSSWWRKNKKSNKKRSGTWTKEPSSSSAARLYSDGTSSFSSSSSNMPLVAVMFKRPRPSSSWSSTGVPSHPFQPRDPISDFGDKWRNRGKRKAPPASSSSSSSSSYDSRLFASINNGKEMIVENENDDSTASLGISTSKSLPFIFVLPKFIGWEVWCLGADLWKMISSPVCLPLCIWMWIGCAIHRLVLTYWQNMFFVSHPNREWNGVIFCISYAIAACGALLSVHFESMMRRHSSVLLVIFSCLSGILLSLLVLVSKYYVFLVVTFVAYHASFEIVFPLASAALAHGIDSSRLAPPFLLNSAVACVVQTLIQFVIGGNVMQLDVYSQFVVFSVAEWVLSLFLIAVVISWVLLPPFLIRLKRYLRRENGITAS